MSVADTSTSYARFLFAVVQDAQRNMIIKFGIADLFSFLFAVVRDAQRNMTSRRSGWSSAAVSIRCRARRAAERQRWRHRCRHIEFLFAVVRDAQRNFTTHALS